MKLGRARSSRDNKFGVAPQCAARRRAPFACERRPGPLNHRLNEWSNIASSVLCGCCRGMARWLLSVFVFLLGIDSRGLQLGDRFPEIVALAQGVEVGKLLQVRDVGV